MIEYGTDTSRTIASLLFTGTASRCPDIKFIFTHGGGTMPFLIERFVRLPLASKDAAAKTPEGVMPLLRRFYYDTAQVTHPAPMSALTKVVPTSQIVFGTDFPFRSSSITSTGCVKYLTRAIFAKSGAITRARCCPGRVRHRPQPVQGKKTAPRERGRLLNSARAATGGSQDRRLFSIFGHPPRTTSRRDGKLFPHAARGRADDAQHQVGVELGVEPTTYTGQ